MGDGARGVPGAGRAARHRRCRVPAMAPASGSASVGRNGTGAGSTVGACSGAAAGTGVVGRLGGRARRVDASGDGVIGRGLGWPRLLVFRRRRGDRRLAAEPGGAYGSYCGCAGPLGDTRPARIPGLRRIPRLLRVARLLIPLGRIRLRVPRRRLLGGVWRALGRIAVRGGMPGWPYPCGGYGCGYPGGGYPAAGPGGGYPGGGYPGGDAGGGYPALPADSARRIGGRYRAGGYPWGGYPGGPYAHGGGAQGAQRYAHAHGGSCPPGVIAWPAGSAPGSCAEPSSGVAQNPQNRNPAGFRPRTSDTGWTTRPAGAATSRRTRTS